MDEIGVDALRYSLARYPSDSPLTLDIEQITRAKASDNPVYYVQYAHARVASILRNAADLGLDPEARTPTPRCSRHEHEGELLRALAEFPRVVQPRAELREPHRVARYLEDTAASFHRFYDSCRVLPQGDEEPGDLHRARLLLVAADPDRPRQRPRACSASPPRSGCEHHPRGGLGARTRRPARSGVAAATRRPQRAGPAPLVDAPRTRTPTAS